MAYEDIDLVTIPIKPYLVDGNRLLEWLGRASKHIGDWHKTRPEYWDWDETEPPADYPRSLVYHIDKLTYHNYIIWHQEDRCRTKDQAAIVVSKPIIDKHNQARNDEIEAIDDLIIANEQPKFAVAPYNSETLGSLVDRCIVTRLKLYHLVELDPTGVKHLPRLNLLLEQNQFLGMAAAQLLDQIRSGERFIKVFRQLKMYNSPDTNPHYNL